MNRAFNAISLSFVLGLQACSSSLPFVPLNTIGTSSSDTPTVSGAREGVRIDTGELSVEVQLKMHDEDGLLRYAQAVSDPASSEYRHFLRPAEIADRFGVSLRDYTRVAKYFTAYGLSVSSWPQRQTLFVSGKVSDLARAIGTDFHVYTLGKERFIGPDKAPALPRNLPVSSVVGLVHRRAFSNALLLTRNRLYGYSPQQVGSAFGFSAAAHRGLTGKGINIAIVGTGPLSPDDMSGFQSTFGNIKLAKVQQMAVTDAGVTRIFSPKPVPTGPLLPLGLKPPPPATAPCPVQYYGFATKQCNPEDSEAQLDTETTASLAPGSNVLFYLAYTPSDCYLLLGDAGKTCEPSGEPAEGILLIDSEIDQIIADNKADIVTISAETNEPNALGTYFNRYGHGLGPDEFAMLTAEGIAVFVSSGDYGAYDCGIPLPPATIYQPCVAYPASDPDVVAVGAVTAPIGDSGAFLAVPTAFGRQTDPGFGSGGGLSTVFSAPRWQSTLGFDGRRAVPDIAMLGDPTTGVTVAYDWRWGPVTIEAGGTSLAAQQMGALWALVLQGCAQDTRCRTGGKGKNPYRLGNPAPILYQIYNSPAYKSAIDDVRYGSDQVSSAPCGQLVAGGGYCAKKGFDLLTGIGLPFPLALDLAVLELEGNHK